MSLLQEIVKNTDEIRPNGAHHSWSRIYEGPGMNLDMRQWNRVLNLDGMEITVQSGMDLRDLMSYLASRGMTIPQMSATVGQTVGGALATATHGASKYGSLSNTVIRAIIVHPDGRMSMTRVTSLIGTTLGNFLLYSVTLRVVPDFPVHLEIHDGNLDTLSSVYRSYIRDPQSIGLVAYYWPGMRVRTILTKRTQDVIGGTLFSKAYSAPYGDLLPMELSSVRNRVEMEQAIDVKDMIPALQSLDPILPKGSILLLRFVGPDRDPLMSMTYKRNSLFISLSLDGTTDFNPLFREMDRRLVPFRARPHWGKINYLTKTRIEALYPGFKAYVVNRRSYDPQGKFLGLNSPFQ